VLYPRNPDLDPQLVWLGKDEQDRQPLEVPAVPIYMGRWGIIEIREPWSAKKEIRAALTRNPR
jgi:hypothetical protein